MWACKKAGLTLFLSSFLSFLTSNFTTPRPFHHISSFPPRDSTPRHEDCRQDCRKGSRKEAILLIRVLPSKDFTGNQRTHVAFSVVNASRKTKFVIFTSGPSLFSILHHLGDRLSLVAPYCSCIWINGGPVWLPSNFLRP